MATTRKSSAVPQTLADLALPDDSANEWAIVDSDATSVTWSNPTSNEKIRLPVGARPSEHIVAIARMNGAVLSAQQEPDDLFPDETGFVDEIEEATPVDRLLTLLRDDPGSERSEVKIYRMREGKPDTYCGSFKPDEFEKQNLELIRSHYGAGKYRVKIYGTKPGTNLYVIRMNQTVEIEPSLIAAPNAGGGADKFDLLLQRLDAQQNQGAQSGMNNMKEMLQMFVMMKQAFGGEAQPKSQIAEIVGAIRELREVSGEISGGSGGNSSPDLMGMGAEVLKLIAQNQGATQVQPHPIQYAEAFPQIETPPAPAQVVQYNPNPAPAIQQPQTEENNEMSPFVKIMFAAILKKAAAGAPVEPIAADLYPRLPDEILDAMESEMWFDLLQEFHAGVKDHEAWFTALRGALLAEIAKDEAGG